MGSHCSWLSAVPGRGFPLPLFLKSSYPARVAVEPNWSQVRHFRDLLRYTVLGKGGEEVPFKEHSQPLSWSSSYSLGPGLTKALSDCPEAWLPCVLSFVLTRLEAYLNLPLYECHLEISLTSELRADVPVGGCCLLSAPLAPATLQKDFKDKRLKGLLCLLFCGKPPGLYLAVVTS